MRFGVLLGTCLFASLLPATCRAEENPLPLGEMARERTFIAPISQKEFFRDEIFLLNKELPPGNALEPIEMEDLGRISITGDFTESAANKLLDAGLEEPPPFEVDLFSGASCDGGGRLEPEAADTVVPPNVCRVTGPPADTKTNAPSNAQNVWIIDSGLDQGVYKSDLLNIISLIDCTTIVNNNCTSDLTLDDDVGHGTMVAGIVGGKRIAKDGGYLGLVGVSPGARLKILKAFKRRKTNIFGFPLYALRYVRDNASAGDILNLSWGADFLEAPRKGGQFKDLKDLDDTLYQIAAKQVRIVIAAGNAEGESDGPWVQTFFPANAATYPALIGANSYIASVSASDSKYVAASGCTLKDGWCDRLWPGGSYGASFAEPGVDVPVLWKSRNGNLRRNVCSGTSLAAPVLAGLWANTPSIKNSAINGGILPAADILGYIKAGKLAGDTDSPTCAN